MVTASGERVMGPDLADDGALEKLCQRSDFVVLALETYSPTVLHALNESAINTRTRWLSVYFDGSEAVIGPTYVPGETCCYHEFETQAQASLRYKAEYLVFKEFLRDTAVDTEPLVLPPYASVAAGFAVTSVVRSLLNGQTFTSGRAMRINFETLSIDMQDVLRLPRCPACGGARPTYRNLFL
jgi:thiazole/oxazole-forming peptide maturase SagC family component